MKTAGGTSGPLKLHVDDLPQSEESEPNQVLATATSVALPVSAWGVLGEKGDVDHFVFEARQGETIVLDLAAQSLGSKLNAVLTLLDARGRVMSATNDFDGQSDPLIAFTAPADGRYVVRMGDLMLAGSAEHFYRLVDRRVPVCHGRLSAERAGQPGDAGGADRLQPAGRAEGRGESRGEGEVRVPIDIPQARSRREMKVLVGTLAREPGGRTQRRSAAGDRGCRAWHGERPASMQRTAAPTSTCTASRARPVRRGSIETDAARRGSPIDTRIEVLDAKGKPVQRLLLQAVRDSYITFRRSTARRSMRA